MKYVRNAQEMISRVFLQYKKPEDEDGFLMLKMTLNTKWCSYPISKVKKVSSTKFGLANRCSAMRTTKSILWSLLLSILRLAMCCRTFSIR